MTLIEAIKTHASSEASAGNWAAVVAAVCAVTHTPEARACFGVETAAALDAVGGRRRAIMAAMQNDPDGRFVLAKLAGTGVVWAHPMTAALMDGLIAAGVMLPADKAALVSLSQPVTRPFADATESQCESAWKIEQSRVRNNQYKDDFNRMLNQLGTDEQETAIESLRSMLTEWETL